MRTLSSFALVCSIVLASCDLTGPDPSRPAQISWVNFTDQADAGGRLTLSLRVTNSKRQTITGATVLWQIQSGVGSMSAASSRTSQDGVASAELMLGPGDNRVVARLPGSSLQAIYAVHGCADCAQWNVVSLGSGGRAWASAVAIHGSIWVLGGEKLFNSTNAIDVFEPVSTAWRRAAELPMPIAGSFATAVQDRIYVIGGYRPEDSFWTGYAAVRALNPSTGEWTERSPLKVGRFFASGAVVDNRIYVVGGHAQCDMEWCSNGPLASLEIYDPLTDQWSNGPPMHHARATAGAAVLHGKLYVAGGTGGNLHSFDQPVAFVEMYDPATNQWSQKAHLPASGAVQLVAANDRLYAIGLDSRTFEYDPVQDSWRRERNTPSPLFGSAATAHEGRVYVFGGYSSADRWWASPIRDAMYVMSR